MTHSLRDGLLYADSIGSDELYQEFTVYDSDSGKWYRTLFDLEMAFWASKYYSVDSLTLPKSLPRYEFKQIQFCFDDYEIQLVGIDKDYQMKYNTQMLNKSWFDNNT